MNDAKNRLRDAGRHDERVVLTPLSGGSGLESYKARFFKPEGRIVDTGNGGVSHTEGQGFAMLMAVANDDKATFDKLWQWTNRELKNKENGLFYWRYNPAESNPVADKNNAADGDVLIAWRCLKPMPAGTKTLRCRIGCHHKSAGCP